MRNAIQLDFSGARPALSLAGGVLLAVGVLAASAVLLEYRNISQHRAGLEVRLASLARAEALSAAPVETPADLRIAVSVQQAATDLATPWTLLLAELEQASKESQGEVALLGVEPDHVAQETTHDACGFCLVAARGWHGDRMRAIIGQLQLALQCATIRMRICPHASRAARGKFGKLTLEATIHIEELLRVVALQPVLEQRQVLGILRRHRQRYLMGAESSFILQTINDLGSSPALGGV